MAREKAWGRALAREVSAHLPEAVHALPDLKLTSAQIQALRKAFETHLVQTMCEHAKPAPGTASGKKS